MYKKFLAIFIFMVGVFGLFFANNASAAPTLTFSASPNPVYPTDIVSGNLTVTLTWSFSEVGNIPSSTCRASGSAGTWTGYLGSSGLKQSVIPNAATNLPKTYTLTCSGPSGTVEKSVIVDLAPPAVDCSCYTAGTYDCGTPYVDSDGGCSIMTDGPGFHNFCESGQIVSKLGRSCDPVAPIPVILTADPSAVVLGTASILKWSSPSDTVSCTTSPSDFQLFGFLNGINAFSTVVPKNLGDNIYKITCIDANNKSGSASVIVKAVPRPVVNLVSDKTSVLSGQPAKLTWTSNNTGSCVGTNFNTNGLLNNSTGVRVYPTVDTTYTIKCTNSVNGSLGGLNEAISSVNINIATPVFPDLVTSSVTPTTADSGVAQYYSATITNIGNSATTIQPFYYYFQKATNYDAGTNVATGIVDLQAGEVRKIITAAGDINDSVEISTVESSTFYSGGTPYMRACADKSNSGPVGLFNVSKITESNSSGTGEDNNCGPWTAIVIPVKPSIIITATPNPIFVPVGKSVPIAVHITSTGIFGNIVLSTPYSNNTNTNPTLSSYSVPVGGGDVTLTLTGYPDPSSSNDGTVTVGAAGYDKDGNTIEGLYTSNVKIIKLNLTSDTPSIVLQKDGTSKDIIVTATKTNVGMGVTFGITSFLKGFDPLVIEKKPGETSTEAKGTLTIGAGSALVGGPYDVIVTANGKDLNNNPISDSVPIQVTVTDVSKPELVAGGVTPVEVKNNTATSFKATITNVGNKPTGVDFSYLFQRADSLEADGKTGVNVSSVGSAGTMKALYEFDNKRFFDTATSPLISFGATETPYLRVCADTDSRGPDKTGAHGVVSEIREDNNCGPWTRINVLAPDLVTGAISPTIVTINKKVNFTADITNRGTYSTENSFWYIFQKTLDTDGSGKIDTKSELDSATYLNDKWQNGLMSKLNVGASNTATFPITTFSTPGKYYVRACADKSSVTSNGLIRELNENNNCTSPWTEITVTHAPTPDLIVSAFASNPVSPRINEPATYSAIIYNNGNAQAGGKISNLFQYDDDTKHSAVSAAQTVKSFSPIVLDAHESTTIKDTYTFTTPGKKYIRVCADKSSATDGVGIIDEIVYDPYNQDRPEDSPNEDNNCGVNGAWAEIIVTSPTQPDLTVGAISPTSVLDGQEFTFTSKITNIGGTSTSSTFYNVMQVASDVNGKDAQTPILASPSPMRVLNGGNDSADASAKYKSNLGKSGEIFIRFCADNNVTWQSTVAESYEGNCGLWTKITVTKPDIQKPDLVVGNVGLFDNKPVVKNTSIKLIAHVTNQGNASTGKGTDDKKTFSNLFQITTNKPQSSQQAMRDLFISKVSAAGIDVKLLANNLMNELGGGGKLDTTTLTYAFPTEGIYYVRACADSNESGPSDVGSAGTISELKENNNCSPTWTTIEVLKNVQPGAVTVTLTATPDKINQKGDPVILYWESSNASSCSSTDVGFDTRGNINNTKLDTIKDVIVNPPDDINTYTITCVGTSTATDTKTVIVKVVGDKNPGYKEN